MRLTLSPPKWSSFSRIQIRDADKGPWRVEIRSAADTLLQTFKIQYGRLIDNGTYSLFTFWIPLAGFIGYPVKQLYFISTLYTFQGNQCYQGAAGFWCPVGGKSGSNTPWVDYNELGKAGRYYSGCFNYNYCL